LYCLIFDPRPAGCSGGGCSSPAPSLSASSANVPDTLSVSGCSGTVNWSNGATGGSIYATVAATYMATCTNSGCTVSGSGSVTVSSSGGDRTNTDGQFLLDWYDETI